MYIEISNVTKEIKNNIVLDHVTLSLEKGRIYGLQGKNGSGKTMLMKAICGLIFPTEGTVTVDGIVLGKNQDFPPSVGALIENPDFIRGLSAFDNLKLLADIRREVNDERIREALEQVGLDPDSKKNSRRFLWG